MSINNTATHATEVTSQVTTCNGGGGALGHPAVYLHLDEHGQAVCPYCSHHFVLKAGAKSGGH
ncbi:hypothetical protein JCM17960_09000 [Magnetospira thiophila]